MNECFLFGIIVNKVEFRFAIGGKHDSIIKFELQLKNGSEYTIIVAGDINRDGKVTTYDLSTFRRYILNLREFDKLEEMAADINVDKQELGVKDYTRMRIEILGEY